MGYIIAIILLLIVVPLLFMMLSRRPSGAGTLDRRARSGGVTHLEPSSDQPTPQPGAVNQPEPGAERRLPPG
ncbi:MAG: hypothetical protein ACREH8_12670 [Opitutaceae bacterium]